MTLPPLLSLPEPPRLPPRSHEVDIPEEVLFESFGELHRVTGWGLYAKLAVIGVVSWTLIALTYILSLSPLMPLLLLAFSLSLGDLNALFQGFGLSLPMVVAMIGLAPVVGGLLGAAAVPAGLWLVGRIRPRELLTEADYRAAVNRRFGIALAAPQLLVFGYLAVSAMVPGLSAWRSLSFSVLAALALLWAVIVSVYALGFASARGSNVLRLPTVAELELRAQQATNPGDRARLWGILLAQDRRHLPRNTTIVSPRFLRSSVWVIVRQHWWVALILGIVLAPMWIITDVYQAFVGLQSMGAFGPGTAPDPQAAPDVSILALSSGIVGLGIWLGIIAATPLLAIVLVPRAGNEPRDLRTYPDATRRLEVNPWERKVINLATLLIILTEVALAVAYFAVLGAGGQFGVLTILWAVVTFALAIPLSGVATRQALVKHLRTIVYGPAHWFMRRATPTAAIIPARGTRTELADDPRVRERRAQERLAQGGVPAGASAELIAQAAAQRGRLPDLGVEDEPALVFTPEPEGPQDEHAIPQRIDDIDRP